MKKKLNLSLLLISLGLAWFCFAFLIYPNLNTIIQTFYFDGHFSLEPLFKLFRSKRAMDSLRNSFVLAFTLIVTVNVLGVFLVLVMDYFDIKGAKVLKLGYYTTLIYSGVVLVSGYKFIYDQNGFMTKVIQQFIPHYSAGWFHGYFAVVFVMTFACTSNHVLFLSNAIKKLDFSTIEAAKTMGASKVKILFSIVFPTLKPTLFALTILTFLTGLAATSAPMIVGGREFETITPMILTFSRSYSSRNLATVLALILGIATIFLLSFMMRSERKGNFMSISKVKVTFQKQKIDHKGMNILIHIIAYLLFIMYAIPVILIILFSFTDASSISNGTLSLEKMTFEHYITAFSSLKALKPYLVSLVYGVVASLLVVALCLLCSHLIHKYSKSKIILILEYLLMIPWLLPTTLIAIGLSITFNQPHWFVGNQIFTGTVWVLLIGYIVIKIPFTLRMTKSVFFNIGSEITEASQNLGASPLYTFRRVILPIVLPATAGVFALNFISILQDYDLTVFLYHPVFEPLGVMIRNATSNQTMADTKALSLVYSVIIMIMSTIIMYLVYSDSSFVKKIFRTWRERKNVLSDDL